jgi:hypothetical protein
MLLDATGRLLQSKTITGLTRAHVKALVELEQMLDTLGLAFQLRCRKCNAEDPTRDGCWGATESNATRYVVECNCTKRIYQGAPDGVVH